jgi:hypothetical protein
MVRRTASQGLEAVAVVTNEAFGALPDGTGQDGPRAAIFRELFFRTRPAADPDGRLVALEADQP